MPWSKIEDVPTRVRTHQGIKLSLDQANKYGEIYDAIKGDTDIDNPAGVAWNTWEGFYKKTDNTWEKKTSDQKMPSKMIEGKENIILKLLKDHSSDGNEQIYAIFRLSKDDDKPGWWLSDTRIIEDVTKDGLEDEFWEGEYMLYPVTLDFVKDTAALHGARLSSLPEGGIHFTIEEIITSSVQSQIEEKQNQEWMESVMFVKELDGTILGIKEAVGKNGKPLIHGIAVSTDISNDHRFPLDVLEKGINSLIGQPLIEGHSDWPYDVKIKDTHGMIVDAWVNKEEKRAEFLAEVEDAKYAYVLENMPHRSKFSVGFRHNYDEEEVEGDNDRKIHVSTSVAFDHLGITGNPADGKAVLLDVKEKMEAKGFKVIMDGDVTTFTSSINDKEGGNNMSKKDEDKKDEVVEKPVEEPVEKPIDDAPEDTAPESEEPKTAPKSAPPTPEEKSDGTDTKTLEQKVNALETGFVAEQKKNQELEQKIASFEKAEKQRKVEEYVDTLIVAKKKFPAQKDALVTQYMTFTEEQMKNEIELNDVAANLSDVFGEKAVVEPAKKEDEPTEFEEPERKTVT